MDDHIPNPPDATDPAQLAMMLLAAIIMIIPFWRIFSKAGYSGWLSLLIVIPIINLILLYFLAFAEWPILKRRESDQITHPNPPTPTV